MIKVPIVNSSGLFSPHMELSKRSVFSYFLSFYFCQILIFEKNVPIKAFIEMSEGKEAISAQKTLNNTFLNKDSCKINVYLSELQTLKLPQNNHKFAKGYSFLIYILLTPPLFIYLSVELFIKDYTSSHSETDSPPLKEQSPTKFSPLARSLFMIPEVCECIHIKQGSNNEEFIIPEESTNFHDKPPPGLEKSFKAFQLQKGIFLEKVATVPNDPKSFVKSAIFESNNKTPSTNESVMFSPPLLEALSANLMLQTNKTNWDDEVSRVLYVKGMSSKVISVKHVYNLFSNFGDIKRIILLRAKEVALIEFETLEFAKLARENLNNLFFFNDYLKISFSNYKEIIPKNISKNTLKEDLLICEKSHSRFKKEKNLNFNSPSQVLHLSNLGKSSCKEENICEFFKDVCEIEALK